jgi:2-polyprenyl-3-methyl-5-hydroxy-6-metoxy-1,4-benzoquinol methylase
MDGEDAAGLAILAGRNAQAVLDDAATEAVARGLQAAEMNLKDHWESIYASKSAEEVSWFQRRPGLSVDLIRRVATRSDAAIIDVGGGASTLVDGLLSSGYTNIAVSDIAAAALRQAQTRLGNAAARVIWRCEDILEASLPEAAFDVWHDRAVFHFLTSAADRMRYIAQVARAVRTNGYVIVATFADDGPQRCSGLDVKRYSASALHAEFGGSFELIDEIRQEHITPSASRQMFQYCLCVYKPPRTSAA